ncbi:TetR-like C-terminal domain-containing protein [Pseudonocardia humida]|uniref:TetR/AcrR family transcriptional regulator C-terminal ligand-binding domain-containing protein n=1 Tax=Pseudonocardia humida TaxID=2800819 RepID=A0ABT1A1T3_9PSEU|nr:TetR-like C-terminal domain-containing protein [Pseudonocardia humida]MCO1656849.1 TetR/AcrR family transcriptional regulator C-terminal ligand-binding domain-containing protein [Pseudonocardia humida]
MTSWREDRLKCRVSADPRFRALVARVLGTSRSHPSIMDTYWRSHVQPRREATRALLGRARDSGALPADTDLDVLMDTMAGAALYRLMQPDDLDAGGMRRYLETLYRQIGLLTR